MTNLLNALLLTIRVHYLRASAVVFIGCLLIFAGIRLLGVQIELYRGIHLIDGSWITAIYLLPFLVGGLMVRLFGAGGSWLCWIPPMIVEGIAYIDTAYISGVPEDAQLIPVGYWVYYVVLMVGDAAIGGFAYQIFKNYKEYSKKRSGNRRKGS